MSTSITTVHRVTAPLDASVTVPGSKSIANRALVCAALAAGTTTVSNLPDGDDVEAMRSCLGALGIEHHGDRDTTTIMGNGSIVPEPDTVVFARLAGTTSRFMAAVASLSATPVTLDGEAPLRRRPFGPLFDALRDLGATIASDDNHLPAVINGPPSGQSVALTGDVSSQFVTALMLIAPRLENGLTVELTSPLVSVPYVEMTAAVQAAFGIAGIAVSERRIEVPNAAYRPGSYEVEPDASSASYPLAIAAINGGTVSIPGLGSTSLQGDVAFASILAEMGCDVEITDRNLTVRRNPDVPLRGVSVNMADISDLVPTMAVVAAVADTETRIDGVGFIRHKESDRLGDLTRELRVLGVDIDELPDGLVIRPSRSRLRPGRVDTHDDHRLAMGFATLASTIGDVEIVDPAVVSKSWPGFWHSLTTLGVPNQPE